MYSICNTSNMLERVIRAVTAADGAARVIAGKTSC